MAEPKGMVHCDVPQIGKVPAGNRVSRDMRRRTGASRAQTLTSNSWNPTPWLSACLRPLWNDSRNSTYCTRKLNSVDSLLASPWSNLLDVSKPAGTFTFNQNAARTRRMQWGRTLKPIR